MSKKTLIVGGVAGGATTAARLRRRNEDMQIIIVEKGEYISYANCGLPYYIGDVIKERDNLLLQTPEAMKKKYNIDVRVSNEVVDIFPEKKTIQVRNLKTNDIYEETYDNLVLATGSSPIKPNIDGIESDKIFTLWSVPDTDKIKSYVTKNLPETAAVIGGGFIGIEMAENLSKLGIKVHVIEMQNQVMGNLDPDMANLVHENMSMNNVNLILGDGVKSFCDKGNLVEITLNSEKIVKADMVILSIGVKPNSELARKAKIKLNARGGIVVDEYLKTSQKDIYAVGDVIEIDNYISKDKTMIPLAGPANKQARILADNLSGDIKKYRGVIGTSVAKVFDLDVASVGFNEKQLNKQGKVKNEDYYSIIIDQKSHAGYYPKATIITLKLLFDKDGKIFGAQAVGQNGVDKRIDTIATTIHFNGTIYDLEELELAYAPPFSSAKDPVNMLGFVAENVLNGLVSFVEWNEVDEMLKNKKDEIVVLDVTEKVEREVFCIDGSYHIPLGELRDRFNELDKDKHIIVYCAIGVRAYNGARVLMQNGFKNVSVMSGGITFYKSMHYMDKINNVKINKDKSENYINENKKNNEKINKDKLENDIEDTIKEENKQIKILNCSGMQCPGPIMKVNETLNSMKKSEILQVTATDIGFANDVKSWCNRTGNTFVKTEKKDEESIVYIKKGAEDIDKVCSEDEKKSNVTVLPQGKTIVVFSGDLDKVLASFVIANGALAMGRKVTMFFTFWGLNALRKNESQSVKKPFVDKMFENMMPRGTKKLKLSNMHMAGMGTKMMRKVMKDKSIDSLEDLMKKAMDNGVKLVACTMSMDVMGITKEELIDGVELAGVASYLGDAEMSNVNLFV